MTARYTRRGIALKVALMFASVPWLMRAGPDLFAQVPGPATTVRGQLMRMFQGQKYPAAGVPVTVNSQALGRSAAAYSGPDGMFYLPNIPYGPYQLEIWVQGFSVGPLSSPILVNQLPFFDVGVRSL
jgi:hypothetical protein